MRQGTILVTLIIKYSCYLVSSFVIYAIKSDRQINSMPLGYKGWLDVIENEETWDGTENLLPKWKHCLNLIDWLICFVIYGLLTFCMSFKKRKYFRV